MEINICFKVSAFESFWVSDGLLSFGLDFHFILHVDVDFIHIGSPSRSFAKRDFNFFFPGLCGFS